MSLHWGKTQAMCVGNALPLERPDGSLFENRDSSQYLGALLTANGRADSEISRKLGLARADFNQLQRQSAAERQSGIFQIIHIV